MIRKTCIVTILLSIVILKQIVVADPAAEKYSKAVERGDIASAYQLQTYFADPFCYDLNTFHGISITKAVNGRVVKPSYPFTYQDMTHLKVRKLRERIGIDDMIADTDSELELIRIISDWANGQWGHMRPLPFPSWDAHEILDRVEAGDSFFCTYKAVLFVQACNAAGLTARILGINRKHGSAHTVTEVYSNEFRKWMLVDPWINCYFERDNAPLSARDLHDSMDDLDGIFLVIGPRGYGQEAKNYSIGAIDSMPGANKKIPCKAEKHSDMYYDIRIVLRNDHMVHPQETENLMTDDGFMIPYNPRGNVWWGPQLKWTDDSTPPSITCENTGEITDFEWPLNEVKVDLKKVSVPGAPLVLRAEFSTHTPSFSHYRLLVDGTEVPLDGDTFSWKLREGRNTLEIASFNTAERGGFPSEFVIEYDPASIDYSSPVTVALKDPGMEKLSEDNTTPSVWKAITPNALKFSEFRLDSKTKHSGQYAIKAEPAKDTNSGIDYAFIVMSERFKVNPATDVIYSIWLKADRDDTPAYFFLWDESRFGLGCGLFNKAVTVGRKWKRYELKCRLHNELTFASVGFKVLKGTVWADDVGYEEVRRQEY